MRGPWIREARLIEPRLMVKPKIRELQTAKEMLAEVFHARPGGGGDDPKYSIKFP